MKKVDFDIDTTDVKNARHEMYVEMTAHKAFMRHLAELGATSATIENNVGLLYDYFESYLSVAECQKAGHCINEEKHHAVTITINGASVFVERHMCPVFLESQQLVMRFLVRDFPENYLDLKISDIPKRQSFALYMRELMNVLKGETYLIYAYGMTGIGKLKTAIPFVTHMLNDDKSKTAGVLDFPAFVRSSIADYFEKKESVDTYLQHYIDLDVLVLDGFGNEEINKLVIESIIFPLLSARIRQKKPTIILAGVSINDLRSLYLGRSVRGQQIVDLIRSNIKDEIYLQGTTL
ncbi:MAG: Primosomal protein DnaI [Tenericutes bacterium ADurb.Bin087]|nr:MAG: Primosomal protein DnaI [Tenericutes bacterium ADurb.Bin087]